MTSHNNIMIINTEYYKDKDDSDYNPDILKLL